MLIKFYHKVTDTILIHTSIRFQSDQKESKDTRKADVMIDDGTIRYLWDILEEFLQEWDEEFAQWFS